MKTVRPHSRTFRCGFLDPSSLPLHLLLKLHVDIEHEFIQSAQGYRFRRFGLRKGILFKRSYKSGVLWYKNLKTWNRRIKKALESIKSLIKCNNMTLPRLQIFFLFFFFLFFLKNARSEKQGSAGFSKSCQSNRHSLKIIYLRKVTFA